MDSSDIAAMNIKQQIEMWLEDTTDLSEGMRLYLLCGGKEKTLFNTYQSIEVAYFNLVNTLSKQFIDHLKTYLDKSEKDNEEKFPIVVLELKEKQIKAYTQYKILKKELFLLSDSDTIKASKRRHQIAVEIMQTIIPEINRTSNLINNFQDNGILPPLVETSSIVKETVSMIKRKESLRTRISKINSLIKKGVNKSEKLILEKELETKERILEGINYQLGL